jgi:hypothetical protein
MRALLILGSLAILLAGCSETAPPEPPLSVRFKAVNGQPFTWRDARGEVVIVANTPCEIPDASAQVGDSWKFAPDRPRRFELRLDPAGWISPVHPDAGPLTLHIEVADMRDPRRQILVSASAALVMAVPIEARREVLYEIRILPPGIRQVPAIPR